MLEKRWAHGWIALFYEYYTRELYSANASWNIEACRQVLTCIMSNVIFFYVKFLSTVYFNNNINLNKVNRFVEPGQLNLSWSITLCVEIGYPKRVFISSFCTKLEFQSLKLLERNAFISKTLSTHKNSKFHSEMFPVPHCRTIAC